MGEEDNKIKDISKAMQNAIASARMEGFEFTDEQISYLTNLAQQAEDGKITWQEAIKIILKKFSKNP